MVEVGSAEKSARILLPVPLVVVPVADTVTTVAHAPEEMADVPREAVPLATTLDGPVGPVAPVAPVFLS